MFEQSASITKLATAMVQVQATLEGAIKGKANPAFKGTKYADLKAVWDACREPLVTNGLSVVQFPGDMVDNRMTMTTQLSHESGEWMRSTLSIPLSKADAQGYGSAVTYARRYALAAVVGVCPEDDDGNAASNRGSAPNVPVARIDDGQRATLIHLAEKSSADMRGFCRFFRIDALPELAATDFDKARDMLNRKLVERANAEAKDAA